MQITHNNGKARKLVALISHSHTCGSYLLLPFSDGRLPEQKTASLGLSSKSTVVCNGTHSIEQCGKHSETYSPIYEGDSVTIQF